MVVCDLDAASNTHCQSVLTCVSGEVKISGMEVESHSFKAYMFRRDVIAGCGFRDECSSPKIIKTGQWYLFLWGCRVASTPPFLHVYYGHFLHPRCPVVPLMSQEQSVLSSAHCLFPYADDTKKNDHVLCLCINIYNVFWIQHNVLWRCP